MTRADLSLLVILRLGNFSQRFLFKKILVQIWIETIWYHGSKIGSVLVFKGINPILNNNFFVSQKFINIFLDV